LAEGDYLEISAKSFMVSHSECSFTGSSAFLVHSLEIISPAFRVIYELQQRQYTEKCSYTLIAAIVLDAV